MTKHVQAGSDSGDRPALEVTPAMVEAGVEVLRARLDYDRFMGHDHELVLELIERAVAAR
jgi:hypothetical protein